MQTRNASRSCDLYQRRPSFIGEPPALRWHYLGRSAFHFNVVYKVLLDSHFSDIYKFHLLVVLRFQQKKTSSCKYLGIWSNVYCMTSVYFQLAAMNHQMLNGPIVLPVPWPKVSPALQVHLAKVSSLLSQE